VLPNRAGGRAALAQALFLASPATACLCYNDVVAIGAIHKMRYRGLVPGRDVAVVGFDDIDEAQQMVPPLTSVAADPVGLGERAAAVLLRQISSGRIRPETIVGPAELVVRASCGGPRPTQGTENTP